MDQWVDNNKYMFCTKTSHGFRALSYNSNRYIKDLNPLVHVHVYFYCRRCEKMIGSVTLSHNSFIIFCSTTMRARQFYSFWRSHLHCTRHWLYPFTSQGCIVYKVVNCRGSIVLSEELDFLIFLCATLKVYHWLCCCTWWIKWLHISCLEPKL